MTFIGMVTIFVSGTSGNFSTQLASRWKIPAFARSASRLVRELL
jgi:hypothetical protein